MSLKALIFDFDGLILDTETPEVVVWEEMYREGGLEFPIDNYLRIVGGDVRGGFDPAAFLASNLGGGVTLAEIRASYEKLSHARIEASQALPGVETLIAEAKREKMRIGIASSSPHSWVDAHLKRLGMFDLFDKIVCADDVMRVKPDPALYLTALRLLNIRASEAVVFEDSANGVTAAKQAGIFCVVVPNPVTVRMTLDHADLRLESLRDINLSVLKTIFPA